MATRQEVNATYDLCLLHGFSPCLWLAPDNVTFAIRDVRPRTSRELANIWEGQTLSDALQACRSFLSSQSPPNSGLSRR